MPEGLTRTYFWWRCLFILYCLVAPAKHTRKESIGCAELEDDLGTGGEAARLQLCISTPWTCCTWSCEPPPLPRHGEYRAALQYRVDHNEQSEIIEK